MLPGEGSGDESSRREWKDVNADLLVQVFSYLPQIELFEVISVSKAWKMAVMEASVLWKEVTVCKKWDLGARGERSGGRVGNQMTEGSRTLRRS